MWSDNVEPLSGNFEIFYRKSTYGGATFDDAINLSNNDGESSSPTISVRGENVYVAWSDGTLGSNDAFYIFYIKSNDRGITFGSTINLSENIESSFGPALESSQNNVYIVWGSGGSTPGEIFYKQSTDNGNTFNDSLNLSNNPGDSNQPSIAVSNAK